MIYLGEFTFPSMPERISISTGAHSLNFNLMDRSATIPKGMDVRSVKWSGTFFGRRRRRTVLVQEWVSPNECVEYIENAIRDKMTLNLIIEEAPVNLDVIISNFSYEAAGGFGDIEYTLELQEAKALKVYTVSELNIKPLAKTVETRPEPAAAAPGNQYTVTPRDTLWKIARKFYKGSGQDFVKIYEANTGVIEAAAKQHGKSSSDHGHWIYPGCVLTIP